MKDESILFAPRDIESLVAALKLAARDATNWGRADDTQLTISPQLAEQLSRVVEKELRNTESQWNREVEAVLLSHLLRACGEFQVSLEERTFMGFLGVEQLFHFEPPRDPRLVLRLRREEGLSQAKAVTAGPQVAARYQGPSGVRVLRCDLHEDGALIEFELSQAGVAGWLPLYVITAHRASSGSPISRLQLTQDGQPVLASTMGAPLGAAKYDRAPIQLSWWKEIGERAGSSDRFIFAEPQDGNHIYAMTVHIQPAALKPQRPALLQLSLPSGNPLRIYPAAVRATLNDEISRKLLPTRGLGAASRSRWALELGESGSFTPDCVCVSREQEMPTAPPNAGEPVGPPAAGESSARALRELLRKLSGQRALTMRLDVADAVLHQLALHPGVSALGLTIVPSSITGHQNFDAVSRQVYTVWRVPVRAEMAPLAPAARGKLAAAGPVISERLRPFLPPGIDILIVYEE